jgi:flagellar protein FlaG
MTMEIQGINSDRFSPVAVEQSQPAQKPAVPVVKAPEPIEAPAAATPPPSQLSYRVDEGLNQVVVSIMDGETGKVIRQIPPDEALALMRRLRETIEHFDKVV